MYWGSIYAAGKDVTNTTTSVTKACKQGNCYELVTINSEGAQPNSCLKHLLK